MTLQEKIQKLISAIKRGVSIYKLDPIGKGGSAKMLMQGKMPTQKKILQMYTNLLIIDQEQATAQNSEAKPEQDADDYIRNEKLRLKKRQVILEAANAGISHNAIDPSGNGGSVRRLLKGCACKPEKIDQMYDAVLAYQQLQLGQSKERFVMLDPNDNPDNERKKALIIQAVASGIQKCKIDTAGCGKAINRLLAGKGVVQITLDMMYANLLALMGYSSPAADSSGSADAHPSPRQSYASLQNQINSLQNIISALADKVHLLETAVGVLKEELQPDRKHTPDKILGTTIMLKDDLVRGKKYRRWYALYTDAQGHRRWIYIGTDVQQAKEKILAWFARHPQASCPHTPVVPASA